jgi:hypothetical protein
VWANTDFPRIGEDNKLLVDENNMMASLRTARPLPMPGSGRIVYGVVSKLCSGFPSL